MTKLSEFRALSARVLDLDEGFKTMPYLDSKGYWTIGRGHYIGKDISLLKLPASVVEALFDEDLEVHLDLTIRVFGKEFFNSLDTARQVGLFCLAFNMGMRIYSFNHTIELIKQSEWTEAANNLRASKWARDVDPKNRHGIGRDDRVIGMIEFGTFDKAYNI